MKPETQEQLVIAKVLAKGLVKSVATPYNKKPLLSWGATAVVGLVIGGMGGALILGGAGVAFSLYTHKL